MSATSSEARFLVAIAAAAALGCGAFSGGPAAPAGGFVRECADGLDNDGDGRADFPADPGCESELDPREQPLATPRACSNGVDDDGDGRMDYDRNGNGVVDAADDPGCQSAADDDEFNVVLPACSDGVDNDGDGRTDYPADPQCAGRNDADEAQ